MSHKIIHHARGIFTTGRKPIFEGKTQKGVINFLIFNIKNIFVVFRVISWMNILKEQNEKRKTIME